jgi:alkanesulfonate monooxygenase SsuD/methylene tetrahydromethanopterin reductase-like flavin-dependent oxidoreductase (luciferase family)
VPLGLGVGGREDDYRAAPAPFHDRGQRFEAQLELMKRIWSGQPLAADTGAIGPPPVQPGGPPLLIGGSSPVAAGRVVRWGDGYIAGGGAPEQARQLYGLVEAAWTAAGRRGKPRFVAGMYWALGPRAAERAAAYIRDYYAFLGPVVDGFAASIPSTPEAIKGAIGAFEAVGLDELVLWPCVPEPEQVDRLADLLG